MTTTAGCFLYATQGLKVKHTGTDSELSSRTLMCLFALLFSKGVSMSTKISAEQLEEIRESFQKVGE